MPISATAVTDLLSDLVQINSVNPAFDGGGTDERLISVRVAAELEAAGFHTRIIGSDATRPSVVGTLGGRSAGKSLMLYAHMDTVGIGGMAEPLSGGVRAGRLYGRGSYDMKGGLAACLAAAHALGSGPRLGGDVVVVAVADEETESIGMRDVLSELRTDGAIVTEPTDLEICVAHKGFAWITVETVGRAAHGSRFDLGIDANIRMGRVLSELEQLEARVRGGRRHALVGPGSLHAGRIEGGTGPSIYSARCRLDIERRTIPGERTEDVVADITEILARLRDADPAFEASAMVTVARPPFEVAADAFIVRTLTDAFDAIVGTQPTVGGQTPWMDAALLSEAGVETVVFGPTGAGAHADEEWVDIESVVTVARVLVAAAERFCNGG